ncbi:UDP-N-acetylmuramoyl-L-alanine--D-glutamate ligase [Paeniglutamicibacter kerguelensis]|uniref:UDP-N-acetylmuramoylalanine--D-glutamate ligase n=1 Tax=Paeniglutamicibacter kerguelensis TaxID=254788 RepID=A0ABS4XDV6_9MICC|nr:UDP-N-acetylmuramoyl-L-alanine--D-glutamate ligase [Paeniglutamicibacter kerguelensis]MBP2386652.1 UDP-N-acetylmuramoylalanine--D-glutamate ligase [Paeniglutamicibacter kerguelensis]
MADLSKLTRWESDWAGLRVVVAGLGLSGFSAADTLIELGAHVVVVDGADTEVNRSRADTLKIVGATDVLLGAAHTDTLPRINGEAPQLVIASPGWNPRQPMLAAAAEAGIEIWGDVELAWRVRTKEGRKLAEWVVITGTNGKTTTVGMTESIFKAAGLRAIAAGNVGTPILDAIRDPEGFDVIALELSSFQLHFTHTISPLASVVLNIAEDHVDWHGGFENYKADKAKIYERTRVAAIYNADERVIEAMVENADVIEGCRAVGFTTGVPSLSMVGVVEDLLVDRAFIEDRRNSAAELVPLDQIGEVVPRHTAANAAAAAALARAYGVEPAAVALGLSNFDAGDHRIQAVARRDDVLWINDSKATNPHAAGASLGAFGSVVWIAGGLSKGVDYNDLVKAHAKRLKAVVVIGTDTAKLVEALERHAPQVPVIMTAVRETGEEATGSAHGWAVMAEAVNQAAAIAEAGDTVLMAPAAASMDQFSSYAQRGNAFIDAVRALMGEDTK